MDTINPQHYKRNGRECFDVMKDMGVDVTHLCMGNIIKYLYRYKGKGGVEDLEKANWYLLKLIHLEKELEEFGENEITAR